MRLFLLAFLLTTGWNSFAQRTCFSQEYAAGLIKQYPSSLSDIEAANNFVKYRLNHRAPLSTAAGSIQPGMSAITIPVVVHVLYNTESQNITDEQVQSQLDALNRDFRRQNFDTSLTPQKFRQYAADTYIQFKLASIDPSGQATTGIVRKKTSIQLFGIDDRIKNSSIGGDDAWDADSYLNIWVGNLAGGMLGYSSVPGGPKAKDGIVIRTNAFGTTGTATAPFNLGRTATHEIGHWLGLQHIWGDAYCGDDQVEDTPPQQSASRGCPTGNITSCSNSGTMYMNFMDFTNDACMNLFTIGQRDRMRVLFQPGGPRYSIVASKGASGKPVLTEQKPPVEPVVSASEKIEVYPNPVQTIITIRFKNGNQQPNVPVSIYNHLGQTVKQVLLTSHTPQVDMSELKTGIYFVKVGEEKPLKVVKR